MALVSSISPFTIALLLKNFEAKFFCTLNATELALNPDIIDTDADSENSSICQKVSDFETYGQENKSNVSVFLHGATFTACALLCVM